MVRSLFNLFFKEFLYCFMGRESLFCFIPSCDYIFILFFSDYLCFSERFFRVFDYPISHIMNMEKKSVYNFFFKGIAIIENHDFKLFSGSNNHCEGIVCFLKRLDIGHRQTFCISGGTVRIVFKDIETVKHGNTCRNLRKGLQLI